MIDIPALTTPNDPTKNQNNPIFKPSKEATFLNGLFYGPPGVGKTTLAATAVNDPRSSEVLFIDIEKGTLALTEPERVGLRVAPDVWPVNGDVKEIEKALQFLQFENHSYRTVVLDTVSEWLKLALDANLKYEMSKNRRESLDHIELKDYGVMTQYMRRMTGKFRDLPLHVFYLCHDDQKPDHRNVQVRQPAITGRLMESFNKNCDFIGYLSLRTLEQGKPPVRILETAPASTLVAKDRTPGQKLNGSIQEPTIQKILDLIQG